MARTCIVNINDIGVLLAEHLKSQGNIEDYEVTGNARVCFEFNGTLTITFEDYIEIHPLRDHLERSEVKLQREEKAFNRWIQTEIIKTLRDGEVVEYAPGKRITVKSTEKTEVICIRITPEEKQKLEKEATEMGLTMSDYIRLKVL